jgi:hypothetical protein
MKINNDKEDLQYKSLSVLREDLGEFVGAYYGTTDGFIDIYSECHDCTRDHKWGRLREKRISSRRGMSI